MIEEGKQAPHFVLNDKENNPVRLEDFRGKKVIVYFYPKDDTPGCTKEACSLRDGFASIQEKNAVILGISPDSPESHEKFTAKYQLPFILLSDPDHQVLEAWGAWGEKNLYGIKSTGVLRSTVLIDEQGKIMKIIKKVDTSAHAEQVLAYL